MSRTVPRSQMWLATSAMLRAVAEAPPSTVPARSGTLPIGFTSAIRSPGSLTIQNGGKVQNQVTYVGRNATGTATVTGRKFQLVNHYFRRRLQRCGYSQYSHNGARDSLR